MKEAAAAAGDNLLHRWRCLRPRRRLSHSGHRPRSGATGAGPWYDGSGGDCGVPGLPGAVQRAGSEPGRPDQWDCSAAPPQVPQPPLAVEMRSVMTGKRS